MKLTRLRIEQFKQFRQPFEIADFTTGLNLFTGPNEAGKSTIVAAIRAAFFERHRSSSVDDLRPWGDASASPSVELDFTLGATSYRLGKRFLGKKRCELQAGSQHLDGVEAEDHLAELFGFQHAGKGASKAEHWGIPGLLWIQQGSAQELRDPVSHATDHLRSVLNTTLGEIASSSGDEVLAKVEALRNELLTTSTGKPRGAYQQALEQTATLEATLQNLDIDIAAYCDKVDRLATLRREHTADAAEQPWTAFRQQEHAATASLEAIRQVETALQADRQRAGQIASQIPLLRGQLETFVSQEQAVATRKTALESMQQNCLAQDALVGQWQTRALAATTHHDAAREILRLARQEATRREHAKQLDEFKRKRETTADALTRAEAEQAALTALHKQLVETEIDPKDLNTLKTQQSELRELRIRRDTVATRLRFALTDGSRIEIGQESVTGSGDRLLTETTRVTLPGLGQLEITPGGTDLAELGRQEQALSDKHVALLQRLGLASLEAAEARHLSHTQHQAEARTAAATLKALAPKGIEALRAEQAGHDARAGEIEQALARLPFAPENMSERPAVAQAEAEATEASARQSLDQINQQLNEARLAAGNAQTAHESAARELAAAQAVLDAPDRAARQSAANQNLVDARAEQDSLAERIDARARQVAEANPDLLQQDVERFGTSAGQLEKQHAERRDILMRLEVELHTTGAQGLEERRSEVARDLEHVRRRSNELQRRAQALDHLLTLLRDKRAVLTRKLQAPLQKHLNRYLQLLFPHASLDIDETLTPGPLTRPGSHGAEISLFEELSFGAREQMGVISRLAYADLLREADRPTLILLDDALVHSDGARLAQMKRLLFDAATRHQILLFTCHPEKWRDLGVGARSLETLRASNNAG
ncbi:MAG: GTP-binding protein [Hydrogenophilales bacterium 16-64-46]|nr:MAG: GTP-binding protein [Hydrogenophilales bacterium 12-64-13]OYZ04759.1 MAG: GTP-binding protein [Hydrogenophilales bacterium 16-64-46]OZA38445.1 MAG: GTP-binding protein [Hydrogenophilales bacterium 17-64-34]HQT00094.1 AAA family ATPase [Thiobacillus sp.]